MIFLKLTFFCRTWIFFLKFTHVFVATDVYALLLKSLPIVFFSYPCLGQNLSSTPVQSVIDLVNNVLNVHSIIKRRQNHKNLNFTRIFACITSVFLPKNACIFTKMSPHKDLGTLFS